MPDAHATIPLDPDLVLETLFVKKNGRPLSPWNALNDSYPAFSHKPLSKKVETLKQIAASIAYFRGAEALSAARERKKVDFNVMTSFGICYDKVAQTQNDDLTIRLPASMLQAYSIGIQIQAAPQASTCLEKTQAVIETSSREINELCDKV